jgi:hypothetical protein
VLLLSNHDFALSLAAKTPLLSHVSQVFVHSPEAYLFFSPLHQLSEAIPSFFPEI